MLLRYEFVIVALGAILLAIACGIVGTFNVFKGQSLIGDVLGHASFPGVVLAFMIWQERHLWVLMTGAIATSVCAYATIVLVKRWTKLSPDTISALVLSSYFGLGMVLKSYMQGNPQYASSAQAGLQSYLFGQAAYMMAADVWFMVVVCVLVILVVVCLFYPLKLYVFDEVYARTQGFNTHALAVLLLVLTVTVISVGLKVVGTVLVSSLIVAPTVSAMCWTRQFKVVLVLTMLVGAVSAGVGTLLSTVITGLPTGATIVVVLSICVIIALVYRQYRLKQVQKVQVD